MSQTHEKRCFSDGGVGLESGDVLAWCNCSQDQPHTPFAPGVAGLTFRCCNLINCDLPEDAILEDCLHVHVESAEPGADGPPEVLSDGD